jgi:glucose-1-phosphate cytidylyltransferase
MKLVIFAGGLGARVLEESDYIPKPMVKIGKKPILWHIIKYYSVFRFSDFIICGGYKMSFIKKYFKNYIKSPILKSLPSIDKIKKLSWLPETSLEEGFAKTIKSFIL